MSSSSFALELLDADGGHVLQTWELGERDLIYLGRSRDSDVIFSNPFVSRTHAALQQTAEGWELQVISTGGVFVHGKRIERLILEDGVVFRLTDRGPWLRFRYEVSLENQSGGATFAFDPARTPVFVLDDAQLKREVEQITAGNYFQELKERMAQIRSRTSTKKTAGESS